MPHRSAESDFQLAAIERLERLRYEYAIGLELERPYVPTNLSRQRSCNSGAGVFWR